MKKYFLLFSIALSCGLYAQAQVAFGIKAGFSAANISAKYEPSGGASAKKSDTKMIPAFHAGVIVDIALDEQLSLQPGLFFSQKGSKEKMLAFPASGNPLEVNYTTRLNYLELPVNLLYKQKIGSGKLVAGLGPYIAYGLSGKVKATVDGGVADQKIDIKFKNTKERTFNEVHVKPFDAGANFTVGYELNMGLLFSVNYSLGLVNTNPYKSEKDKNRYLGVSVGYLFKR